MEQPSEKVNTVKLWQGSCMLACTQYQPFDT